MPIIQIQMWVKYVNFLTLVFPHTVVQQETWLHLSHMINWSSSAWIILVELTLICKLLTLHHRSLSRRWTNKHHLKRMQLFLHSVWKHWRVTAGAPGKMMTFIMDIMWMLWCCWASCWDLTSNDDPIYPLARSILGLRPVFTWLKHGHFLNSSNDLVSLPQYLPFPY